MDYMNAKACLDSHYVDCTPSFAWAPYSTEYIKERIHTRAIIVVLGIKTLVIIAGPYEQLTPVNYYDPSGHSAILIGLLIGAALGFVVGVGYATYADCSDDNSINGSVGAEAYLGYGLLGGVIGGTLGAGIGYIWPALSTFAASSFTIGDGISMSGGAVALSSGICITGAQILEGAGVLAGLGIMAFIIGKSGGYTVKKFPNDHDPAHVHIFGDDISDKAHGIRIGIDGKPLPGQGKLPPGAKKALKKLWELILKSLLS